jgi:hypothetical protein
MEIDRIVLNVIKKFEKRADEGLKKYGVTLERTDLSTLDWIEHAQDELMDGILYLERLKQNFKVMEKTAVEFLVEQLEVEFFLTDKDVENVINQAKEMEKQQIIDAYRSGVYDGGENVSQYNMNAEQYYNETFKQQEQ